MAQKDLKAVKIFLLSHLSNDANYQRKRLLVHLEPLRRRLDVLFYDSSEIAPGKIYASEIERHLQTANIILFLISPDFIAHYHRDGREVDHAIKRYDEENIRIIPILLVPAAWKETPLAKFLPKEGQSVSQWPDQEVACLNIKEEIDKAVDEVYKEKAANETRKRDYINKARAHFHQGNYRAALDDYERAIQIDRSDASLYEDKGDVQFALKEFEKALISYESALKLTSEPSGLLSGKKGQALFNLARYSEAEIAYQQAIRCTPDKADFFIGLGDTRLAPGRLKDAIASYERGCQLEPGNAQFHIKLGDAHLKNANVKQALASYESAYKLEPTNAQSCVKLGDVYLSLSSHIKAIDYYEQAIRLQPQDAKIHRSKARAQFAFAKLSNTNGAYYTKALETYRIALTLDANDPYSYKEVGDIFLRLWQLDNALDAYERAIRLKPDFSQAYRCQGDVFDKKASELQERARQARKKADEIEHSNNK